jgi:hypothetical protein
VEGGFSHASDLVKYIREKYGDFFSIAVAGRKWMKVMWGNGWNWIMQTFVFLSFFCLVWFGVFFFFASSVWSSPILALLTQRLSWEASGRHELRGGFETPQIQDWLWR